MEENSFESDSSAGYTSNSWSVADMFATAYAFSYNGVLHRKSPTGINIYGLDQ